MLKRYQEVLEDRDEYSFLFKNSLVTSIFIIDKSKNPIFKETEIIDLLNESSKNIIHIQCKKESDKHLE